MSATYAIRENVHYTLGLILLHTELILSRIRWGQNLGQFFVYKDNNGPLMKKTKISADNPDIFEIPAIKKIFVIFWD